MPRYTLPGPVQRLGRGAREGGQRPVGCVKRTEHCHCPSCSLRPSASTTSTVDSDGLNFGGVDSKFDDVSDKFIRFSLQFVVLVVVKLLLVI